MDDAKIDETKGRAKEAAGAITDDEELKREGKADQAASKVKEKVEQAKDKAEDLVDGAKEKASGMMGRDR